MIKTAQLSSVSQNNKVLLVLSMPAIVLMTFLLALPNSAVTADETPLGPNVLSSVSTEVEAVSFGCVLNFTVRPENRVPATGNWGTQVQLRIYDTGNTLLDEIDTVTNSLGEASVDLCARDTFLSGGDYEFRAKGLSHLRKNFGTFTGFSSAFTTIDLSQGTTVLLEAGETSNTFDNEINTLDLVVQIADYKSTTDELTDLNQDGVVNSLDYSATITNFGTQGDD